MWGHAKALGRQSVFARSVCGAMDTSAVGSHPLLLGDVNGKEADRTVEHAATRGEAQKGERFFDGERRLVADEVRVDLELEHACEQRACEDVPASRGTMP